MLQNVSVCSMPIGSSECARGFGDLVRVGSEDGDRARTEPDELGALLSFFLYSLTEHAIALYPTRWLLWVAMLPIAAAVGGVVVMRYGENPREVIERVKAKVASLQSELNGIKIHGVYDRTVLIDETVATLSDALGHEIAVTIAIMVLFLLHVRASMVIAITLPMAVLMSVIAMKVFGVDANIMSLAGIAIAIGTMVIHGTTWVIEWFLDE